MNSRLIQVHHTAMEVLRCMTVEPVLFLYMFATFMQYTAFQDLLYKKVCLSHHNHTVCDDLNHEDNVEELALVQKDASMWILVSTVSQALPSIVTANLLGSWGDTFGRKYPLAIPSIGGVLSSLVYIWMSLTPVSVWPIALASALSGIFGGFVSCIMAVMSYVSNVSSTPARTKRVSLLEAMTYLGATAGPFAGAGLLACSNQATVFLVIALCHVVLVVYVATRVSEVTVVAGREDGAYCSMGHFKSSTEACFRQRPGRARTAIMCFLVCCLVIMLTTAGELDVSYLYVKDQPLQWDYTKYSYYFGLKYALGSLALLVGTPLLAHFGVSDHAMCAVGIVSKIAGFVLLGFSNTDTLMFLVPLTSMLSFYCIPALRSLLSKQVDSAELGKMFAFVASIENLSMLLGSVIFNSLYPITKAVHRGFIFQIAALFQIIPLAILCLTSLWHPPTTPPISYASLSAPII